MPKPNADMMTKNQKTSSMGRNLVIIPARGGSRGIPGKNIKTLAGKPLIAHTIEAARNARQVDRVVVSTDSPEIGELSKQYGAEVVWRPAEISGDRASSESALLHVMDHLHRTERYSADLIIFLQCTSPLTASEDIDGTVEALISAQADTALAVAPFHYFLWEVDGAGSATGINHDKNVRLMRQERTPQYIETGAIYVMKADLFRRHKHRFFGKTAVYIMPPERRWEIYEPVDFRVAEVLLREQPHQKQIGVLPPSIAALVMDFDGVFTDNTVSVNQDGTEAVVCSRADGLGLSRLAKIGIPMLVLSTEENPVVAARCKKMDLGCLQGIQNKKLALWQWAEENAINLANTLYVGNDINDLECLRAVGCGVAVADAHPEVKNASRLILQNFGGRGAIRELCDLIVANMEKNGSKSEHL